MNQSLTQPILHALSRSPRPLSLALVAGGLAAAVLASGCGSSGSGALQTFGTAARVQPGELVIDGSVGEWPEDVAIACDEHYVYLRVKVEDSAASLQAADESLVFWMDIDSDPSTGLTPTGARDLSAMGVDLAVEFSPRSPEGPRGGVRVQRYDASGTAVDVNHADMALHFAPTYASEWTEIRFARNGDLVPMLDARTSAAGVFALYDSDGELVGWSDPLAIELPAGESPPLGEDYLPVAPEGTVRIMSWNALRDGPSQNPAPFQRVIQAINPDVVLIQEWDAPGEEIASWFNRTMGSMAGAEDQTWTVRDSAAWGVAIASRHPMSPLGPDSPDPAPGGRHPTRFVGGLVVTPVGDVAVGSVHLKCCGGAGGREDQTRLAEAFLINQLFGDAVDQAAPGAARVVGGDLNLVGSREPLDALRTGLDSDGGDLSVAHATVLGDSILATWENRESRYTSGRLDWTLVGEEDAELVQSFVLDTSRLSDAALARLGLDRTDTAASDHNPLVVDIKPKARW